MMDSHYSVSYDRCLSDLGSAGNPVESIANALSTGVNELG
jgi:hypothetical protein